MSDKKAATNAKTTRPNMKIILDGSRTERCPKHRGSYVKDGVCPECEAEKKGKK